MISRKSQRGSHENVPLPAALLLNATEFRVVRACADGHATRPAAAAALSPHAGERSAEITSLKPAVGGRNVSPRCGLWAKKRTCGGFSVRISVSHRTGAFRVTASTSRRAARRAHGATGRRVTRGHGIRIPIRRNREADPSDPALLHPLWSVCRDPVRVSSGRTAVKPRRESMRERARREPEYTAAPTTYRHGLGLGFRHVTPVRDLSARPPLPRAITAR